MSIFTKILGGGLQSIVGIVEPFINTPAKKQAFELELKSIETQLTTQIEETYRKELDARADIIKSEMAQGDLYTKRARPSIVYMGLIFIALTYVIFPWLSYFIGTPKEQMPIIELPSEFWWSWGTVVSIYGVGRSTEKNGTINKLTNFVTGSGAINSK